MITEANAVLAVTLLQEYFPEGDDICRVAGLHLARELSKYLESNGHTVPNWVKDGCAEDAWGYLESEHWDVQYQYHIAFFSSAKDDHRMAIQYNIKVGWLRRLLRGQLPLAIDDPIHELLRDFGAKYENSSLMTASEFAVLY